MSYTAAVDHLHALGQELAPPSPGEPRRKFDLAHMRALTAALGYPERATPAVLIAGTNGKGSTAATLASIVAAAGYRTGLYTSPHLQRVNERIQLSTPVAPTEYSSADAPGSAGPAHLTAIADEDFARLYFRVDSTADHRVTHGVLPHSPSFFERLTALAFLYFQERHAEIAILEVGLGGRLDATNIVEPLLSIITDIALDHQDYLGNTIAAITREKAGILRDGGTLITLPQHPEANQTLGEIAATLPNLRAISAADLMPAAQRSSRGLKEVPLSPSLVQDGLGQNRYVVSFNEEELAVDSPLAGSHQQRNLALAITAARELRNTHGYKIEVDAVRNGIRETVWPGRLQSLRLARHSMLLDVAHNPAGAWTLRSAIAGLRPHVPRTLLFSCLRDKNLEEMSQILFPLFDGSATDLDRQRDHIVFGPLANARAASIEEMLAAAQRLDIPASAASNLASALARAIEVTPPSGLIVVTGSVYLIGSVLATINQERPRESPVSDVDAAELYGVPSGTLC